MLGTHIVQHADPLPLRCNLVGHSAFFIDVFVHTEVHIAAVNYGAHPDWAARLRQVAEAASDPPPDHAQLSWLRHKQMRFMSCATSAQEE